jgi:prepilin-type N-terminal cleavage/methylation domain-containing protein
MLTDVANAYDREVNIALTRMTAMLEPMMIVADGRQRRLHRIFHHAADHDAQPDGRTVTDRDTDPRNFAGSRTQIMNIPTQPLSRPSRRRRLSRGMTLIEILVVLAIIGLIVGGVSVVAFNAFAESKVKAGYNDVINDEGNCEQYLLQKNDKCPKSRGPQGRERRLPRTEGPVGRGLRHHLPRRARPGRCVPRSAPTARPAAATTSTAGSRRRPKKTRRTAASSASDVIDASTR